MYLLDVYLLNFRNLEETNLSFEKGINLFYGENGQGKTSFIEALYFNMTGKSFRTKNISDILKYNKLDCGIFLNYLDIYGEKSLALKYEKRQKKYFYNKKKVNYDEYIGKVNVISFIPEDIALINSSPSIRRSYFDYEISQSNYNYYLEIKELNKILKVRNKFLKEKNIKNEMYNIYNEKFIDISAKVLIKREEYIKKLSILLNLNYRKLFKSKSELKLIYKPFVADIEKENLEKIKEKIREKALKVQKKELMYGYSLIGPQRDEYIFQLNEKDAKKYSSQGEKKSIIFSLKISEIDLIVKDKKEYPIFLLDDVSSYFDLMHKDSILNYFFNKNIQVFITSTEKLDIKGKKFLVKEGKIYE